MSGLRLYLVAPDQEGMRRYIAVFLALLMMFALAACSFSTDKPPAETAAPASATETFKAENELCRVTLTQPAETDAGYDFAVTLENRTEAPLTFLVETAGFNGLRLFTDPFGVFEVVEGGETKDVSFTVEKTALAAYDIGQMDSVDVTIRAFAEDNPEAMNGVMTMMLTPDAAEAARMALAGEQTLIGEGGITVAAGNAAADATGCAVTLWCENATDADVQVTLEHITCGGQDTHEFSGFTVPAGTKGYGQLRVDAETLQGLGLVAADVRDLSFDLAVEDAAGQALADAGSVTCAVQ